MINRMFYKDEKKMFGESGIWHRFSKRKKSNDQKNAIKREHTEDKETKSEEQNKKKMNHSVAM